MEFDAINQKDSGKPIIIDMKIEIGIGAPPAMEGPSGKEEYTNLLKCYYVCYKFLGTYKCKRYCWQKFVTGLEGGSVLE